MAFSVAGGRDCEWRMQDTALPEGNRSGMCCQRGSRLLTVPRRYFDTVFFLESRASWHKAANSGDLGAEPPRRRLSFSAAGSIVHGVGL